MRDTKKILEENFNLKKENEELRTRLKIVRVWMEKEVKEQTHKIAKKNTSKFSQETREGFISENFEEVIANRISDYFGDLLLLNAPKGTIEGITSAEINYYNMMKNPHIDGFAIISAYHKVLDLCVETFIINNFRKFAKKKGQTILRVNDPLEKALNLIVNNKYIMSIGRLYGILRLIREEKEIYDYGLCFKDYLNKYTELRDVLLDDDFFSKFTFLNKSEVLSTKRHSGTISKDETGKARKVLIGDFTDKSSIIYKLLESQSVMY